MIRHFAFVLLSQACSGVIAKVTVEEAKNSDDGDEASAFTQFPPRKWASNLVSPLVSPKKSAQTFVRTVVF